MKIYIGSDHAGYELKNTLIPFVQQLGHEVEDKGAFSFDSTDDYPDFITPTAQAVAENSGSMGIVLGGSGQGEAVCANKVPGIRCALYYGDPGTQTDITGAVLDMIASVRTHNDANMLSIAARFVDAEETKRVVKIFLETPFSQDERHIRRINKIG